jgi:hypothetical protein
MALTPENLMLPDAELRQLQAALANSGIYNPATRAISEAESVVNQYTARYLLPDAWRERLVRPIAIHQLYQLLGRVPEAHQKAYEAAMQELRDIRDGKFSDVLPPAEAPPTPASTGDWGSETKFTV